MASFVFFLVSYTLFSQNENYPHQIQSLYHARRSNLTPLNKDFVSTVITVDNWDNFNLGIDVAENTITSNPLIPNHFFSAFNLNSGHHAEDGLNWLSVVPDFGSTMKGCPVAAYDSLGNLFYGNMYGTSTVLGLKVIRSSDNGITWGPGITALSGNDKCWIACDQTKGPNANNVYTCMTNNGLGNFSRSTDHGLSYTSTFAPSTQTLPGMMACVGPDNNIPGGSVYVVTNSGDPFASTYTFYRSLDGGITFTQMSSQQFSNYVGTEVNGSNSVSGMRTRPFPLIAADNSFGLHRGRLYLVYASNDPPGNGNKPDIFCRYSLDEGTTWSSAKKVNDDANPQNNNHWHPAIWCDKETGRLYVQWMDSRDTPTHDSAYIYASYSDDGGLTFRVNQRISNQKMVINCLTCGGSGIPSNEGDNNGICSNKKVAMVSWTDFRNGTFMSTTGYFPDFAMAIDHNLDTLFTTLDSTLFNISIPEVKLYSDTVLLSGTVFPLPSTGTISISFPSGIRMTTFPGSLPVKIRLSGVVPPGDYQIQLIAKGPNGTPVHQRNATIRVLSGDAVYLIATATPDTICAGATSQLLASTIKGTAPFTFSWTPSTGLNNPNIADPIASPINTTFYHVHVVDAVSHVATDSVLINIIPTPVPPGVISGPEVVCHDSLASYNIQRIPGATSYSWTVPSGSEIVSGQNTNNILVHWGNTGGSISVIAGNECGNSNPGVLSVTVTGPPSEPATIHGPALACKFSRVNFDVDPVPEATSYFWTVPADASILNGQTTDSVSVQWGDNTGDVSVLALGNCGASNLRVQTVGLETLPGPTGEIEGNDTVCSNHETYIYAVTPITGVSTYAWSVPPGTSIISGMGTSSIVLTINPEAVSGTITVKGNNSCGSGNASSKNIDVKTCIGIDENKSLLGILIYPNPAEGNLNIDILNEEQPLVLQIVDLRGKLVFWKRIKTVSGEVHQQVNLSTFSRGVYFVEVYNSQQFVVKKIILQ